MNDVYLYRAVLLRVYDGDTFWIDLDLGCNVWLKNRAVRLWSMRHGPIDTPELRGKEAERGRAVRDVVKDLLGEPGSRITVRTMKDESGKYGRLLADALITTQDEPFFLGDFLVKSGMAQIKDW